MGAHQRPWWTGRALPLWGPVLGVFIDEMWGASELDFGRGVRPAGARKAAAGRRACGRVSSSPLARFPAGSLRRTRGPCCPAPSPSAQTQPAPPRADRLHILHTARRRGLRRTLQALGDTLRTGLYRRITRTYPRGLRARWPWRERCAFVGGGKNRGALFTRCQSWAHGEGERQRSAVQETSL